MLCTNKGLRAFLLKLAAAARKIYAPLTYWVLYILFFRRHIKSLRSMMINVYGDFPRQQSLQGLKSVMSVLKWKRERRWFLDFTYLHPELFLSDILTDRWGRDCDDFAMQWHTYFVSKGWDEVYSILLTVWGGMDTLRRSHIIVIARNSRSNPSEGYTLLDNGRCITGYPHESTVEDVMRAYAYDRSAKGIDQGDMIWCYYRKHKNYK